MSQPTRSMIHVNKPLTNVSVAYLQDATNFIADKIFPVVPVVKQSDLYFTYDKGDLLRTESKTRGAGSESAGRGYKVANTPYFTHVHAIHQDVADQDRENADVPLNLDIDATEILTQDILMRREIDWFSAYYKTGVWTNPDFTPTTLWDAVNSVPIDDVISQVEVIISTTGMSPRDMDLTISPDVWTVLRNHPQVMDRIKYTQRGIATEDLFAALCGIRQVYVGRGVTNTAVEGAPPVVGYIATPKDCLLSYSPKAPSLKKPAAGYTFTWSAYAAAGFKTAVVKKFRMEPLESDRIEVQLAYDMKPVALDAAVFFNNVIS